MDEKTFLGTGWSFPPTFSPDEGTVEMVSNTLDILQSLKVLVSTLPGERILLPDYGCNLTPLVFENITAGLFTKIKDIISNAIIKCEPRINLIDVYFTEGNQEGQLNIEIDYVIRTTNSRQNFVFPYYLNEGTYI